MSRFIHGVFGDAWARHYNQTAPYDRSWRKIGGRRGYQHSHQIRHDTNGRRKLAGLMRSKFCWPAGGRMMSGGIDGYAMVGAEVLTPNRIIYNASYSRGNNVTKYVIGQVVDSGGTGISGAVVSLYRTSDDLHVSTVTADSLGNYKAPTPHSGVAHYARGYLDTATDQTGATINTIIPTNADGS